jgi:hypothetical protein
MSLTETDQRPSQPTGAPRPPVRTNSQQFSTLAKSAIMSNAQATPTSPVRPLTVPPDYERSQTVRHATATVDTRSEYHASLMPPPTTGTGRAANGLAHPPPRALGAALTDTPMPSEPGSPQMSVADYLHTYSVLTVFLDSLEPSQDRPHRSFELLPSIFPVLRSPKSRPMVA